MTALLYSVAAGALAVAIEAHFKSVTAYWPYLWAYVPLAIVLNWLVFQIVHNSPSLPAAFVLFSGATLTFRVGWSWWLGHPMGVGTWAAVGLLALASALRLWRP